MPMREFVDERGERWRVWSVEIDQAYGAGAREEYLGELHEGWLCFECSRERRRLPHFPADWHTMTERQLLALLERATAVPRRSNIGSQELGPSGS